MSKSIKEFFKPVTKDSSGSLPVPSTAVQWAKREVQQQQEHSVKAGTKRGVYGVVSPDDKAKIAKYAAENGVSASLRHFKRGNAFPDLKESTVRGWAKAYKDGLSTGGSVFKLPERRRGRPLLLGKDLDDQVKAFVQDLRSSGSVVNTAITIAAAKGIVLAKDANLLAENGGSINLTKDWAKRLLHRIGFVKRRATTKFKLTPGQFDSLKAQFLADICTVASMEGIPQELIINWDQTGVKYVPVSTWTLEKKGATRVEIAGMDDKRQITATLAGTMSGHFLPAQIIYSGKTPACLPNVEFPEDWFVTFTPNHWANEDTMIGYINNIILPYVTGMRVKLQLPQTHPALAIFDHFEGQLTPRVQDCLEDNHIIMIDVPANCTDRLQPMDLSVNKPFKDQLKTSFQYWYSDQVRMQLMQIGEHRPVDLRLSVLKPMGAKWLINAFAYIQDNPDIIKNGFKEAGITDALSSA